MVLVGREWHPSQQVGYDGRVQERARPPHELSEDAKSRMHSYPSLSKILKDYPSSPTDAGPTLLTGLDGDGEAQRRKARAAAKKKEVLAQAKEALAAVAQAPGQETMAGSGSGSSGGSLSATLGQSVFVNQQGWSSDGNPFSAAVDALTTCEYTNTYTLVGSGASGANASAVLRITEHGSVPSRCLFGANRCTTYKLQQGGGHGRSGKSNPQVLARFEKGCGFQTAGCGVNQTLTVRDREGEGKGKKRNLGKVVAESPCCTVSDATARGVGAILGAAVASSSAGPAGGASGAVACGVATACCVCLPSSRRLCSSGIQVHEQQFSQRNGRPAGAEPRHSFSVGPSERCQLSLCLHPCLRSTSFNVDEMAADSAAAKYAWGETGGSGTGSGGASGFASGVGMGATGGARIVKRCTPDCPLGASVPSFPRQYTVVFPPGASANQKKLLLGSALMVDSTYYE